MKKFLKIFIPLLILGALAYQFRSRLGEQLSPAWNTVKNQIFLIVPCAEPIPYNLGTFDAKFNISKSYFLSALTDAEAIWEKPSGIDLFTYASTDSGSQVLKINLVYDYRQQATSKLAGLGIVVQDNRASYDMLKAKFTALKTEFAKAESDYNTRVQSFNDRQKVYEDEVIFWNKKGGAPKEEFDKLESERLVLETESRELQILKAHIKNTVDEINALVVVLNRLVGTLNLSVSQYNTINGARGESFEEGVYVSNGLSREIDIYEFSSRAKLVRVLAHELGHALGLDHVDDPKAIMYKLNQGSNMTLNATDLAALKTKCQVK